MRHLLLLTAFATSIACGPPRDLRGLTGEFPVSTHVDDWRDEIVYQVITDRFANGDLSNDHRVEPGVLARYQGGDWQGLTGRLDYLEALGITAIWISPIVRNVDHDAGVDGYHGYWAQDLTELNPHFGDLGALRALSRACHQRGMKLILDVVANHMGQVFFYDINLNGQADEMLSGSGRQSPVTRITEWDPDWDPRGIQAFTSLGEAGPAPAVFLHQADIFRVPPKPAILARPEAYTRKGRVVDWDDPDQVLHGDFPGGLKDLDLAHPEVREALVESYLYWILAADLDGLRIDTIKHADGDFWTFFAGTLRERLATAGKERFLLFGESFSGDTAAVAPFTAPGQLDSVVHFPQKYRVFDAVFARGEPTSAIEQLRQERGQHYGDTPQVGGAGQAPTQLLVNFIDNHDVPRFAYLNDDPGALRAALAYLLTSDGIPALYYGTEQGFAGGNDPANREPLWWSGYDQGHPTFQWIATLTAIRQERPALRRGDLRLRWTSARGIGAEDAGIVAFERQHHGGDGDYALVVINAQGEQASRTAAGGERMQIDRPAGEVLVDLLDQSTHTVEAGGRLSVEVPPHGCRILVPRVG